MLEGCAVLQLRHELTDNACGCASTQPEQGRHLPVPALLYQVMAYAPAAQKIITWTMPIC